MSLEREDGGDIRSRGREGEKWTMKRFMVD